MRRPLSLFGVTPRLSLFGIFTTVLVGLLTACSGWAAEPDSQHTTRGIDKSGANDEGDAVARWLSQFPPDLLPDERRQDAAQAIDRDLRARRDATNRADMQAWQALTSREAWEAFRDERIARLRASLGKLPPASSEPPPRMQITRCTELAGYEVRNILFESRPGDWVAGHLYAPLSMPRSDQRDSLRPGIVIVSSHHRSKEQGELQEMGHLWAKAGCYVLVIDEVGYGERRAHPFHSAGDYRGEYAVSRQDYYHRYDSGIQLQLTGDSLMGWFVHDLHRSVDVLLALPGIDREKIIILGAVAGGGDPAAVAAALDRRIACCVPFNFGGAQPETVYPLPEDAEQSFNYLMGSYWDSTRGLYRTGADGFLHWVITASIAPRPLIYAHEFAWDRQRDPVWKRYQRIYSEFYGVPERLAYTHGSGSVRGRPPESTHCTNIGRVHRRTIHEAFARWYGIQVSEAERFQPRTGEALLCFTPEARKELKPKSLVELVHNLGESRAEAFRGKLAPIQSAAEYRKVLREAWAPKLGHVDAWKVEQVVELPPAANRNDSSEAPPSQLAVHRLLLRLERGFELPLLLLRPSGKAAQRLPVVLAVAQQGKEAFLEQRSKQIAELLEAGVAICLLDVRGTGELSRGTDRGRRSGDGNRSVNMLLHGETLLGHRLGDVRSAIAWLQSSNGIDPKRIAVWGASVAALNDADLDFQVPRGISGRPAQSEPAGGMLALLAALFDEQVAAVAVDGGLAAYLDVLSHYQVYIPHDVVVPGALECGDWCDVAAAVAPRPLRMQRLVDGLNRPVDREQLNAEYAAAAARYKAAAAADQLQLHASEDEPPSLAAWFIDALR